MSEDGKKISFGFTKSIKKPILQNVKSQEEKKVDYVECLDEKAIKVIGEEKEKHEPLVIPLLGSRTWHDRIINRIDADIFESKSISDTKESDIKIEKNPIEIHNGNIAVDGVNSTLVQVKTEPSDNIEEPVATLDERAAKEIIEDLKTAEETNCKENALCLPVTENQSLRGQEESTLEDYQQIPVDAFGIAMLRGMGWQPGKGIGKNEKIVAAVIPELRPKGMGLGADKVSVQKQTDNLKNRTEEELKLQKGTYVKIIVGKQRNSYGQIEGLDDDAGRLIVKMALGGNSISVNEFMVQPVTKTEYSQNAKVLNSLKYEEYKNTKRYNPQKERYSESSDDNANINEERLKKDDRHWQNNDKLMKSINKKRKLKKHKRYSSCSDSDSEIKIKKRKSSRDRITYKVKDTKKPKKDKEHDSSPEHSSKKHKKKHKEHKRSKNRKEKDLEFIDSKKYRKLEKLQSKSSSKR